MSNLAKLDFVALDISGKNYLSWINDAEVHLKAMNLGETIKEGNEASSVDQAKAMIFLKRHIHEGLKCEYLTVKDLLALWGNLKERYDHQRTVILPKGCHDWMHLHLQDFKSVADYNSALFRISSKLRLCGENITDADLLEKTFTTFHASNVFLQQQYRERAEQNNELLMQNHQSRPTGSAPLNEVNSALAPSHEAYATSSHGDCRRGRGCGRGTHNGPDQNSNSNRLGPRNTQASHNHQKWNKQDKANSSQHSADRVIEEACHRCGTNGHWARVCRTPKHLRSRRNLLSFNDIRMNGYHIETRKDHNIEYLCITTNINSQRQILETLPAFSSGLYYTTIKAVEVHAIMNQKFIDPKTFMLWHDRLGHLGSTMMHRIISNSNGHPLKPHHSTLSIDQSCKACSQGKLIIRPSPSKLGFECPSFLQRIQGDICGPIHPSCGPFRYFMVLIDASTKWSHVCLLSTRNVAFARLLAQIIKLRAQFPDNPIKSIRLDNADEFTSQTFDAYCMSLGIDVEHPVPHVHTQNGLAEAFIKRLQFIARTLLLKTELPTSAWGHAILHGATLVRLRPVAQHQFSPLQLAFGRQPNISHLRVFGCAVYVPIAPPQHTKMVPQRQLGIYIGFDSPTIIRYLEPMTGDTFTACFADCHYDETFFPPLGGEKTVPEERRELGWNISIMSHLDPRTTQSENEVRTIVHLQQIANQMPDAFTNTGKVTKSHIHAANTPTMIDIPIGLTNVAANESSTARLKRGRPIGSKDLAPRKRKSKAYFNLNENAHEDIIGKEIDLEPTIDPESESVIERTQAPEEEKIPNTVIQKFL
ncbi:unnamed protein product [Prunus brigantina]